MVMLPLTQSFYSLHHKPTHPLFLQHNQQLQQPSLHLTYLEHQTSGYFNASSFVFLSSSSRFPQSLTAYLCNATVTSTANFCYAAINSLIDFVTITCPILKNFDVIISLYLSFSYINPTIQAIL